MRLLSTLLMLTILTSCMNEPTNDKSIIQNGIVSIKLLEDQLFKDYDKAFLEDMKLSYEYRNEVVNIKAKEEIKLKIKNKTIKSFNEWILAMEKAGHKNFKTRYLKSLKVKITRDKLFEEYPELKENLKIFTTFFVKNSSFQVNTLPQQTKNESKK
jgi:DNA repair exonuclease SbcCD nuclease subunit